jgi:hypothetical protein
VHAHAEAGHGAGALTHDHTGTGKLQLPCALTAGPHKDPANRWMTTHKGSSRANQSLASLNIYCGSHEHFSSLKQMSGSVDQAAERQRIAGKANFLPVVPTHASMQMNGQSKSNACEHAVLPPSEFSLSTACRQISTCSGSPSIPCA